MVMSDCANADADVALDDEPPYTFPRHVHSGDSAARPHEGSMSPGVVGPTLSSRPAYHSSSARSITALQNSVGKGLCYY